MAPLRALLEDPAVPKVGQNAKYDLLVLRRAGITLSGLVSDTMVASYVLDPGRRSHGLDLLALEFLDHTMTSYQDLCGKGKAEVPFDVVPIACARDYSCEDADVTWQLEQRFRPQLEVQQIFDLYRDIEIPLIDNLTTGTGGVPINEDQIKALDTVLENLELIGSPALKAAIAAERTALDKPLEDFVGMSILQASTELLGAPSYLLFMPNVTRIDEEGQAAD